ncbi:MAG: MarR family winged helix-turn-helix transcriptional regulator [Myxococcota bacterium]
MAAPRRLYFLLNRAQQALRRRADRHCIEALGISTLQAGAIFFVGANPGCGQRELAAGIGQQESATTGLVGRLEAGGWLARRRRERDARVQELHLTRSGRRMIERLGPLLSELNERVEAGFEARDLDAVARFLETLIERAEDDARWVRGRNA